MDLIAGFELVKQGAEARIYVGNYLGRSALAKERFEKKYRHPILDANITKDRMKAEVRAIMRCKVAGIRTPALYLVDLGKRLIIMENIKGITVKQHIENLEAEFNKSDEKDGDIRESPLRQLGNDIGQLVGCLHSSNIIHGDLTSSNILYQEEQKLENSGDGGQDPDPLCHIPVPSSGWQRLALIDFGLSKIDNSAEDKGVDLYVLERALGSTHPNVADSIIFPAILEGYSGQVGKGSRDILAKFEEVRMRGRKRTMVG